MTRLLVLGGSSYVAQFIFERYFKQRQEVGDASTAEYVVACTLRASSSSESTLPVGFTSSPPDPDSGEQLVHVYWNVDLLSMTGVRECIRHFRPDVIVNCIAMSSPALCEKDPEKAKAINEVQHQVFLFLQMCVFPIALVEFIQQEIDWRVRFVHFSTDFVYEGSNPPEQGYKETDAALSSSSPSLTVYGTVKLRFDDFLLRQTNLRGAVLRIANVVGPQAPFFPNQPPKFMQWLHQQLFQESRDTPLSPLTLWSDEIRSYIYVRDLVAILFALLDAPSSSHTMTLLNIGGADALSRVELAERYCEAYQRSSATNGSALPRITRELAPTSRATVNLGYHPPLDARLNTALLKHLLPSFSLTPTERSMDEICQQLTIDM